MKFDNCRRNSGEVTLTSAISSRTLTSAKTAAQYVHMPTLPMAA
ncbi:MAG: hypothetical protein ABW318_17040 [Vicinamibacterales bacterium]